mgnify:CR=1 FL=1
MSIAILRLLYYVAGFLLIVLTISVTAFNLVREFDRYRSKSESIQSANSLAAQNKIRTLTK